MKRRDFIARSGAILLLFPLGKGALVIAEGETAGVLTEQEAELLERFVYLLFPHDNISKRPYSTVVHGIQGQTNAQRILDQLRAGIKALNEARGTRWLTLPEQDQIAVMKALEHEPFFKMLYNQSMVELYQNRELWNAIGYQGSSVEYGGYLHRGFDDINWLSEH